MSPRFLVLLAVLCWACTPPLAAVAPARADTSAAPAHPYDPAYPRVLVVVESLESDATGDDPAPLTGDLERTLGQIGNLTLAPRAARRGPPPRAPHGSAGPFAIGGQARTFTTGATTTVTLQLYVRDLRAGLIVGAITVHGSAAQIGRARTAAFDAAATAIWQRFQQIL